MNSYLTLEHPARYYIFFLLSRRRYTWKEILAQMVRQNMPVPRDSRGFDEFTAALQQAQLEMQFPANFDPKNSSHVPSAKWLQQHRILDAWAEEPEVSYAFDLLDQPSIRRELEIMLLGPLNYIDIASRLASLHGLDPAVMNVATVRYYSHYFWNIDAVSAQKWPAVIASIAASEDYGAVFAAPRSQVGAAMSVYIATRGGSGIPKEQVMFRYVRDCCFMEFIKVAATKAPGMGKANAMQGLVNSLIAAQEQVDMRRGGSAELLDELHRMEQRFDDRRLTTVAELPLHHLPMEQEHEKENAS